MIFTTPTGHVFKKKSVAEIIFCSCPQQNEIKVHIPEGTKWRDDSGWRQSRKHRFSVCFSVHTWFPVGTHYYPVSTWLKALLCAYHSAEGRRICTSLDEKYLDPHIGHRRTRRLASMLGHICSPLEYLFSAKVKESMEHGALLESNISLSFLLSRRPCRHYHTFIVCWPLRYWFQSIVLKWIGFISKHQSPLFSIVLSFATNVFRMAGNNIGNPCPCAKFSR